MLCAHTRRARWLVSVSRCHLGLERVESPTTKDNGLVVPASPKPCHRCSKKGEGSDRTFQSPIESSVAMSHRRKPDCPAQPNDTTSECENGVLAYRRPCWATAPGEARLRRCRRTLSACRATPGSTNSLEGKAQIGGDAVTVQAERHIHRLSTPTCSRTRRTANRRNDATAASPQRCASQH